MQAERAVETFLLVPEPTLRGMAFRDGTVPVTAISQRNTLLEKPALEQRCLTPLGHVQLQGSSQAAGLRWASIQGQPGVSQLCH